MTFYCCYKTSLCYVNKVIKLVVPRTRNDFFVKYYRNKIAVVGKHTIQVYNYKKSSFINVWLCAMTSFAENENNERTNEYNIFYF